MNTGIITYVAHPDLLNYTGEDEEFRVGEWTRLISEAIRLDIPLEYNLLGMSLGRNYPTDGFWCLCAELGPKVIIGCDSHDAERVANKDELARAREYLDSLGLSVLDKIELKKVF